MLTKRSKFPNYKFKEEMKKIQGVVNLSGFLLYNG